jgi:hypothetical protein
MIKIPNKKCRIILVLSSFFIIHLFSIEIVGSDDVQITDFSVNIPLCKSITKYGNPVLIGGVWHYVNITLNDEVNKMSFLLYYGDNHHALVEKDETNYYHWEYNQGNWKDLQHDYRYLKEKYCHHDIKFYSFYIGIDQYTKLGNWTLELFINEKPLFSQNIYVENATASLILRSIPVRIQVEPFTEGSYESKEKFIVENKGNIPLNLSINYGNYYDIFSAKNFNNILRPDQIGRYAILVHSRPSWQPGILKIKSEEISVKGEALFVIPQKRTVSLIESTVSIGLPLELYIEHLGYDLESLAGDITFQYLQNLRIFHGETRDIYAYISGNGYVTLDIGGKDLIISKILSGDAEISTPITFQSTNTTEYTVAIRIRSKRPNTTAYLYYDLESGGERQIFTTTIHIDSSLPTKKNLRESFIAEAFIASCILIVVAYIIFTRLRHRRK